MLKENFVVITRLERGISISSQKPEKKQLNGQTEEKSQKYEESSKGKGFRLTPPKRVRNSQQLGSQFKDITQNGQRRPSKLLPKQASKLRLSCQIQLTKRQQLSLNRQSFELLANLNEIITKTMLKQLISKEIVVKNLCNHYIIKYEVLTGLLQKIFLSFVNVKIGKTSQSLVFLDKTLEQIQKMVKKVNTSSKMLKNHLNRHSVQILVADSMVHYEQESQQYILQIEKQKTLLLNEVKELTTRRQALIQENVRIKTETEGLARQIGEYHNIIEKLTSETLQKQLSLQQYSRLLNLAENDYMDIRDYAEKQTRNLHVKNASQDYKEIEASIYDYASYLQANQLANSFTYESIPLKNQRFILDGLEAQLKGVNNIILSNNYSLEEKARTMRDFVLKVMAEHKRKDVEYEKAIEFKTRSICKFVDMMKKWLDNWTLKQEYLVGLRKQFAVDSRAFAEHFEALCEKRMCTACREANGKAITEMRETFLKIEENYKMGNSFY